LKFETLCAAGVCLLLPVFAPVAAGQVVFTTFSAGNGQTVASSINAEGTVAGTLYTFDIYGEGFVRTRQGVITTFQAVQLPPMSSDLLTGTTASGINRDGVVVGNTFVEEYELSQGFVRAENGTIGTFAWQDALTTLPSVINSAGEIAGRWKGGDPLYYGFIRDPQGNIQTFAVPGQKGNLFVNGINASGEIVGSYYVNASTNQLFCFLRYSDGTVFPFNVPGAQDSAASSINSAGVIVGSYDGNKHGFLRSSAGEFSTFDVAGATSIYPATINDDGQVVGSYVDAHNVTHGFLRQSNGQVITVDVPGATSTSVNDINVNGEMTGSYTNASGTGGFVATLGPCL
jgi:hypothetical protein